MDLIDTATAAKLLAVRPRTVRDWRDTGRMTAQVTIGRTAASRTPAWNRDDLLEWARAGKPEGHEWPALDLSDWLSVEDVADVLGVTTEMVRYYRDRAEFPPPDARVGRLKLWERGTVAEWADTHWPADVRAAERAALDARDRLIEGP